jgi:hypothetical protein
MEQYDKHQMGEITESQFYRAFVRPKLTEADMTLLRDKYSDPEKAGLINYLNFVRDLDAISRTDKTIFSPNKTLEQTAFVGIEEKVKLISPFIFLKNRIFSSLNNVQYKKF